MSKKQKKRLIKIVITTVLMIVFAITKPKGTPGLALHLTLYMFIGFDVLKKAFSGILHKQIFDENFLMAVASLGAIAIAVLESGDYFEAVAVMLFYQIGEWFQSYAVGKSRKNIGELMDIRPDYANVFSNGLIEKVSPDEVEIGSTVVVKPGEKIPIDGIIIEGNSCIDTSALTGESVPHDVGESDEVISGCINMTGVLKVKTTKLFGESTVSKILNLVENAGSRKSKSEAFISKFAAVYTPVVCVSALVLAVLPPLINIALDMNSAFNIWLYRALTFLVVSCPCALVISIPLSFFAGIGGASREGILVKGSNFMEALSKTRYVVFDKTGTLTQGKFEVSKVRAVNIDEARLIELAAIAESTSSHPISKSIVEKYGMDIDNTRLSNVSEISGKGIIAKIDDTDIAVGNKKLMDCIKVEVPQNFDEGTVIYVALCGEYAGSIYVEDVVKSTSKEAIESLKKIGIKQTVMLTGDKAYTAQKVSGELKIDKVYSELLPEEKVLRLEEILEVSPQNEKLAFCGDGINDAAVLSRADIGIAMGAIGSDAAIEAADVVLMDDNPLKIVKAIKISKKCMRIVYENCAFAIGIKLACLVLTAVGIADMWLGIFADVGVMIIAVLNAMRALYVRK